MEISRRLFKQLVGHLKNEHRMCIRRFSFTTDFLELYCRWCGMTVAVGTPGLITAIGDAIVDGSLQIARSSKLAAVCDEQLRLKKDFRGESVLTDVRALSFSEESFDVSRILQAVPGTLNR
jgi:hypothetical protein